MYLIFGLQFVAAILLKQAESNVPIPIPSRPIPITGVCTNNITNCSLYGKAACQGQFVPWSIKYCAKYCGFCNTNGTQNSFNTGCLYRNTTYRIGQKWDDGCTYTCTCLDSFGGFKCLPKCQTYNNIPQGCRLEKIPGDCCTHVVCSKPNVLHWHTIPASRHTFPSTTIHRQTPKATRTIQPTLPPTTTQPTLPPTTVRSTLPPTTTQPTLPPMTVRPTLPPPIQPIKSSTIQPTTPQEPGCFYMGTVYKLGDHWYDGCKYSCSCIGGHSGVYRCSERCLRWKLPSSCHLEPPKIGQCCETPKCPSNVHLSYPPGYLP